MNRTPWRIRTLLAAVVAALSAAGVTLSLTADQIDAFVAAVVVVGGALAELGILRDGEAETTPVDDPIGRDGLPLVPWSVFEQQRQAPDHTLSDTEIDDLYRARGTD